MQDEAWNERQAREFCGRFLRPPKLDASNNRDEIVRNLHPRLTEVHVRVILVGQKENDALCLLSIRRTAGLVEIKKECGKMMMATMLLLVVSVVVSKMIRTTRPTRARALFLGGRRAVAKVRSTCF
jgi:hypothetical protein